MSAKLFMRQHAVIHSEFIFLVIFEEMVITFLLYSIGHGGRGADGGEGLDF